MRTHTLSVRKNKLSKWTCTLALLSATLFGACKKEQQTNPGTMSDNHSTASFKEHLIELGAKYHNKNGTVKARPSDYKIIQIIMVKSFAYAMACDNQAASIPVEGDYFKLWTPFLTARQAQTTLSADYDAPLPANAWQNFTSQNFSQDAYFTTSADLWAKASAQNINADIVNNSFNVNVKSFLTSNYYYTPIQNLNAVFNNHESSMISIVNNINSYVSASGFDYESAVNNSSFTPDAKDVMNTFYGQISTMSLSDAADYCGLVVHNPGPYSGLTLMTFNFLIMAQLNGELAEAEEYLKDHGMPHP